MKRISGSQCFLHLFTNSTSQHVPVTALSVFESKVVCLVLRHVDIRGIFSSIAFEIGLFNTDHVERKSAEKSDLFTQAQIFAGTTTPKPTNASAVIFSTLWRRWFIFIKKISKQMVSSHSQKFFKMVVLKKSQENTCVGFSF